MIKIRTIFVKIIKSNNLVLVDHVEINKLTNKKI